VPVPHTQVCPHVEMRCHIISQRPSVICHLFRPLMKRRYTWNWITQCLLVLVAAFALKLHYSTASADQLRWILAPTAALVELVSGAAFEFESHAGYISRERGFLIANSCAGVNFLIAAFLMLSMRKLLGDRSKGMAWGFIPTAALIAYSATLVANTARITIALLLRQSSVQIGWLNPDQLHRFEGVFVYFGFLLLLFVVSEKMGSEKTSVSLRRSLFPLLVYYAIALGVPLVTGAYRQGTEFWRHALFVLLIPLLLTISSFIIQRVVQVAIFGPGSQGSAKTAFQ
jgi:exosortase K